MKDLEIGTAIIEYNRSGKVTRAFFNPAMKIEVPAGLKEAMKSPTLIATKENADIVLASWFNKLTEIELADRNKFEIVSQVIKCDVWAGVQTVKLCAIKYFFKEVVITEKATI